MGKPFFSIIIPCYNQAHFLTKAIESIQCQHFQNWEAIIINDGSTDQTRQIADKLRIGDKRVVLINQPNSGLSNARNAGIKKAKGRIFNFMDADDWLLTDCLQLVFKKFRENDPDILVSGFTYFKDLHPIHTHSFSLNEVPFARLTEGNIAPPVAFFIKSDIIQTVGYFDSSLKSCEDWDYWIRAGKSGFRFFSIPEILVAYRYSPDSMSRIPKQMYEALLVVSKRAISIKSSVSTDELINLDYDMGFAQKAKHHFMKCLGVSLYQGKLEESIAWYMSEKEKFGWTYGRKDWCGLSSNLSFKYFQTSAELDEVLNKVRPVVSAFLRSVGYTENENVEILSIVFAPQLKKRNHMKYGKILGAILNKLRIWM